MVLLVCIRFVFIITSHKRRGFTTSFLINKIPFERIFSNANDGCLKVQSELCVIKEFYVFTQRHRIAKGLVDMKFSSVNNWLIDMLRKTNDFN